MPCPPPRKKGFIGLSAIIVVFSFVTWEGAELDLSLTDEMNENPDPQAKQRSLTDFKTYLWLNFAN